MSVQEKTMQRLVFAVFALAFATTAPFAASAAGALAVGQTRDVAKDGVAIGVSGDYSRVAEARAEALKKCKTSDATAAARDRCRIVRDLERACAAIAFDPGVGTRGFGWGVAKSEPDAKEHALAATKLRANERALAGCRSTADPGRSGYCRVAGISCDGF
jgi:hypothetical protein